MKSSYSDLDYASGRLYGTIVKFQDRFVYVSNTMGDIFEIKDLETHKCEEVPFKELDMNPIEVGNIVLEDTTRYCVRYPQRQWKQGLRVQQILNLPGFAIDIFGRNFLNMLKGEYGNLSDRYDLVFNGEVSSSPLTKHWSMRKRDGKDLDLVFKDKVVGSFAPSLSNITPTFKNQYTFLQELFEDTMQKQKEFAK